ncbi:hypothetical protein F967_02572 [Acinetobacter sp. CIP 102637]|jgi:catechol 2,3-dioxygenase-like lactoylglutathione lyase family enzyme|nr:hypothetical protein F967_02572 [Acinetobacter sp. CIP 102637]
MKISHLDHLVLTVADIKTTCQFYHSALNFEVISFGEKPKGTAIPFLEIENKKTHEYLYPIQPLKHFLPNKHSQP